jgi:hypothetical protein
VDLSRRCCPIGRETGSLISTTQTRISCSVFCVLLKLSMAASSLTECWCEYAAGSVLLILRWITRCRTVGFRNWTWDDWFSVSAWVFFTLLYTMVEYIGNYSLRKNCSKCDLPALGSCFRCSNRHVPRTTRGLNTRTPNILPQRRPGDVCIILLAHRPFLEFERNPDSVLSSPDVRCKVR